MSSTEKTRADSVQTPYLNYTATDFVIDAAFLQHHLYPNEDSTRFWSDWIRQYPEKQEDWQQAVQLLEAVRLGLNDYVRTYLTPEAEAALLLRIRASNAALDETMRVRSLWNRPWLRYAAAACFVLFMGVAYMRYREGQTPASPYQTYVATLNETMVEKVNNDTRPVIFHLPDSSKVQLFPKSRLSYDGHFGQENRSVYLSGKAFFEVVKQPHKPFFVYANELITKVLGTEFSVEAYPNDKRVEVQVRTGKVSVFTQTDLQKQQHLTHRESEGIVLTPNQQIVLHRAELRLSKTLVPQPEILIPPAQMPSFEFDEAPVSEVFSRLEKAYGVHIVYDEDLLASCTITASLTEESLAEKIRLICRGIGAKSETIDAQIIIYAKGCQ